MAFLKNVGKKIVESLVSVKVWIIVALLIVSTYLVTHGFIGGGEWAAVNGGVISTVFAMREAFKVAKVNSDDDSKGMMP